MTRIHHLAAMTLLVVVASVGAADPDKFFADTLQPTFAEHCVKCLTCVRSCPFEVPKFDEKEKEIQIDEALCQGCGVCTCVCPRQVIGLSYYEDDQILTKIDALLGGE